MDATIDWTEAFAGAGAAPCPKCGKSAFFAAQDVKPMPGTKDRYRDIAGIWICFECGHEDRQPVR